MSNSYIFFILFIFVYVLNNISSTIILPFNYKNKKDNIQNSKFDEKNEKTLYFESLMDNTIYTSMKVYNQEIDFHLSMERYPIYINDEIYKKFNDKNIDNKKDTLSLYSLDRIGINRAAIINKTFVVKSNTTSENSIQEINLFRARKFLNTSESERNRRGYASEEAEIGFNIVRGSQYQYVEETENDIDTEEIQEEYEREKERQKAYEEYYNLGKNKTKTDISSYNPLNEYDYHNDYEEDDPKRPYDNNDIYNQDDDDNNQKKNPGYNNNNGNNKSNNDKKKEENKEKEKFLGDGLFKEESANFISQLKKKDKINSYAFTIKYNSNSEEKGEIIIGDLPHEYAPNIYSPENYFYDSVSITKEPPFNWHFIYKKCLYDQEQIDTRNTVKFSIDFGFLRGNTKLQKYLDENFFNKNSCFKDKTNNNYYVYYCEEKAIKNLKPITFELDSKYCPTNLNAKFEFTYKDLFIKKNDIYYFQIVFPSDGSYSNWVFGKPLFKKYQMVFDQDRKTYGFYVKINDKKNDNKLEKSLKTSWTLVIILIFVSLILGYFLCKLLAKLPRRLKANELEDNFTYDSANSKYGQISENNLGNNFDVNGKNKLYENL